MRLWLDHPDGCGLYDDGAAGGAACGVAVAELKKRRRCTPVVVRPPRTVPITPEDYELAVHAIATMIAQWWDANGRTMPDTE
jgi:hypothetical protein